MVNTTSANDFLRAQFSRILNEVGDELAEEAAVAAADKARRRVREAFAKYATSAALQVNAEFFGHEVRITLKIPGELVTVEKDAVLRTLMGSKP